MAKDLLKFISKIALFLIIVFCVDRLTGKILELISARCPGDKDYYELKLADEDIIILGSSRAYHNYNPVVLEDSLGVSVRNCGYEGMGIINMYAKFKSILERRKPKLIVYDLFYVFDYYKEGNGDLSKYTSPLRRFSGDPAIRDVIVNIDSKDKVKTLSSLYCYNSKSIGIIINYITQNEGEYIKGFSPVDRVLEPDKAVKNGEVYNRVDDNKVKYLETFIKEVQVNGIPLVFVISPYYYEVDYSDYYNGLVDLCAKHNVRLLDYSHNPSITTDSRYFYDASHLNSTGANTYSKILVTELRQYLN